LTVAGTDSSGGAGIVADAKTFEAHGVWATVAVTAVTAQDTAGVYEIHAVAPELVLAQIERVRADVGPAAAKTGMLATAETVEVVAGALRGLPLVVDPVMAASHGSLLLAGDAADVLAKLLVPMATVVTPNLAEASALTGAEVQTRDDMETAARLLVGSGAQAAFVTGGHLPDRDEAADCLVLAGAGRAIWLEGRRIDQRHTHGSGCLLSAAVTARLARGDDIETACRGAKAWTAGALAAGWALGRGVGPVDPGWERSSGRPW
jgi:hydroxymethylpyrimidine/phosphomethylpyrimidine kinase